LKNKNTNLKNREFWVFSGFSSNSILGGLLLPFFCLSFLFGAIIYGLFFISEEASVREGLMQETLDKERALGSFQDYLAGVKEDVSRLSLTDMDIFSTEVSTLAITNGVSIQSIQILPNVYSGEGAQFMPGSRVVNLEMKGYFRDIRQILKDLQMFYPTMSVNYMNIARDLEDEHIRVNMELFLTDYSKGLKE
jgi:hypothetical protein